MDVRVGTWNLENLFRPGGEFGPGDDTIYRQKLDGLAAMIENMAPDILGVEEVGSPTHSTTWSLCSPASGTSSCRSTSTPTI